MVASAEFPADVAQVSPGCIRQNTLTESSLMATKQDQTQHRQHSHFVGTEDVLAMFSPIGVHAARRLIANDSRFPLPIVGGSGPGSRAVYSAKQVEGYFEKVHREGFPAAVIAAAKEGV
jgi:hypothetical protein